MAVLGCKSSAQTERRQDRFYLIYLLVKSLLKQNLIVMDSAFPNITQCLSAGLFFFYLSLETQIV